MRPIRGIALMAGALAAASAAVAPAIEDASRRQPGPSIRPVYRKSAKLNRSRHWPYAETYEEARAMSLSSRPVS